MRLLAMVTIALMVAAATSTAQARTSSTTWHQRTVTFLRHRIIVNRQATWRYQRMAGHSPTRTAHAERRTQSIPFLRWVRRLWAHRKLAARRVLIGTAVQHTSIPGVICQVFGPSQCAEAKAVAYCESRYSIHAINGQYLGLFQMGSNERATYGLRDAKHHLLYSTAYQQTVAAHNYFVVAGWGPWSCA